MLLKRRPKFLLAYGAIGGNAMPLWIAKEQGIFRKYNLEPQLIYIIAGRAMQSMLAGDIQFGLLGAYPCHQRGHRGRRYDDAARHGRQS